MHPWLPSSAGQQPQRRHDSSVPGHDCQPPHQPLGGAEANRSHLGDASVLLHRLGHGRGTASTSGKPQKIGLSISCATGGAEVEPKRPRSRAAGSAMPSWQLKPPLPAKKSITPRFQNRPQKNLLPTSHPITTIVPDTIAFEAISIAMPDSLSALFYRLNTMHYLALS